MTKQKNKEIEASLLAGEIFMAVESARRFGPIEGFNIDMEAITRLVDSDLEAWNHLVDLIHAVIDRHIGKVIAEDEEGSQPLPYRNPSDGDE